MTTYPSPTATLRHDSGVAVLDKASLLLSVLEDGPASVSRIVALTGLTRPTAHRLALALQRLRLVTRDNGGRFLLGPRLGEMAVTEHGDRMLAQATPVLAELREETGASARLHRRCDGHQLCVAVAETADPATPPLPVGTAAGLRSGPVAQVLLAWEEPDVLYQGLVEARGSPPRCWRRCATAAGPRARAGPVRRTHWPFRYAGPAAGSSRRSRCPARRPCRTRGSAPRR